MLGPNVLAQRERLFWQVLRAALDPARGADADWICSALQVVAVVTDQVEKSLDERVALVAMSAPTSSSWTDDPQLHGTSIRGDTRLLLAHGSAGGSAAAWLGTRVGATAAGRAAGGSSHGDASPRVTALGMNGAPQVGPRPHGHARLRRRCWTTRRHWRPSECDQGQPEWEATGRRIVPTAWRIPRRRRPNPSPAAGHRPTAACVGPWAERDGREAEMATGRGGDVDRSRAVGPVEADVLETARRTGADTERPAGRGGRDGEPVEGVEEPVVVGRGVARAEGARARRGGDRAASGRGEGQPAPGQRGEAGEVVAPVRLSVGGVRGRRLESEDEVGLLGSPGWCAILRGRSK